MSSWHGTELHFSACPPSFFPCPSSFQLSVDKLCSLPSGSLVSFHHVSATKHTRAHAPPKKHNVPTARGPRPEVQQYVHCLGRTLIRQCKSSDRAGVVRDGGKERGEFKKEKGGLESEQTEREWQQMGKSGSRMARSRDETAREERETGTNDRREELRRWTTVQKSVPWHWVALIHTGQLFRMGIKGAQFLSAETARPPHNGRIQTRLSLNKIILLDFFCSDELQ